MVCLAFLSPGWCCSDSHGRTPPQPFQVPFASPESFKTTSTSCGDQTQGSQSGQESQLSLQVDTQMWDRVQVVHQSSVTLVDVSLS